VAIHAPLHKVNPALQVNPHCPPAQVDCEFAGPLGQALSQEPQLLTSVKKLLVKVHAPLHNVKPTLQVNPHCPPEQVDCELAGPLGQVLSQEPQLLTSVKKPLVKVHAPLHNVKPTLQVNPHCPPLQVDCEFAGPFGQSLPQEPQLLTSVKKPLVKVHAPLHNVKPALQVNPHCPPLQVDCEFAGPFGQALPQEPQLLTLVKKPLVKVHAPLHNVKPALQVNPHCPPLQVDCEFAGPFGQALPQEPQLLTLVKKPLVKVHAPLQNV